MPEIVVNLMSPSRRKYYICYWNDPVTGLEKTKSTKTNKQRDAERFRARLELELNSGEDVNANALWKTAADRYEAENLASRAPKTLGKWKGTRHKVETHINPKLANALNASQISRLQGCLRAEGLAEASIKSHLAHLKAALRWMERLGFIQRCPIIDMPKRTERMRGRAITQEEFERILARLQSKEPEKRVVSDCLMDAWVKMFKGLWLSGLRLGEALELDWTKGNFVIVISGPPEDQTVRLKIAALADKSTQFRILPLAPDFAAFLLQTPEQERKGRVFRPIVPGQINAEIRLDTCSKFIEHVGKAAGVVECERPIPGQTDGKGKPKLRKKFASAHSFRRAFGTRWSKRLKPQDLQVLMRHKDIKTTLTFYAETDAETVESALKQLSTDISTDTSQILESETVAKP